MAKQRVDMRLDPELLEWADGYAKTRGVTRTEVLEEGVRSFRRDCEAGVPELREMAGRQAYAQAGADSERGVGVCPDRLPGLGHVWAGLKPERGGGPSNPCRFCGTSGREFFNQATAERTKLFSRLRTPDSIAGRKPKS